LPNHRLLKLPRKPVFLSKSKSPTKNATKMEKISKQVDSLFRE